MQAPAGGAPGVRTRGRKADDGSHTPSPPPPAEGQVPRLVPAPCLRPAYARGRTARTPPPPNPLLPHPPRKGARTARSRRGDMGGGGRGQTDAPGGETGGGRWRRKKNKEQSKPTCQGKKARRQGPIPRRTGGGRGDMGPQETLVRYPTLGVWGPQRRNPPPHCSQVPHSVLASCLRRACDMRATKGRRQGRPPPPPTHHRPPKGGG